MGKLILFLLIAVAVYWWLRKQRPGARREDAGATGEAVTMVSCHHCGLHVPLKESVADNGRRYCSEEHRRLDAGSKRG